MCAAAASLTSTTPRETGIGYNLPLNKLVGNKMQLKYFSN